MIIHSFVGFIYVFDLVIVIILVRYFSYLALSRFQSKRPFFGLCPFTKPRGSPQERFFPYCESNSQSCAIFSMYTDHLFCIGTSAKVAESNFDHFPAWISTSFSYIWSCPVPTILTQATLPTMDSSCHLSHHCICVGTWSTSKLSIYGKRTQSLIASTRLLNTGFFQYL